MLLFHLAAQKVGQALPRRKVVIHRPVEGLAGRIIDPVLAGPGSEQRIAGSDKRMDLPNQRGRCIILVEVNNMLLAVDCGNTQVVLGVFDQDKLLASWRMSTNARRTADEYMVFLNQK